MSFSLTEDTVELIPEARQICKGIVHSLVPDFVERQQFQLWQGATSFRFRLWLTGEHSCDQEPGSEGRG